MEDSSEAAPVMTDTGLDSSDNVDSNHRLADSQPCSADLAYDLHIHNQTLLWKARPKPSYNSQVCFDCFHLFFNVMIGWLY